MARILVADDSDEIREMLKKIIEMGQHEVIGEAENGQQAIKKFRELQPDVMLLDIAMPKKSGLEVLKELNEEFPNMKVIMITANGSTDVYFECIKYGAIGYIDKPFEMKELLDQIAEAQNLLVKN